jgi:uncharacterized protein
MRGMDVQTGKNLEGVLHLKQSIANILSTPVGSRVMRRDYGSRLFDKIDHPLDGNLIAEMYADVVEALFQWEPRFELMQVTVVNLKQGTITLDLEGRYVADGSLIQLQGIEIERN